MNGKQATGKKCPSLGGFVCFGGCKSGSASPSSYQVVWVGKLAPDFRLRPGSVQMGLAFSNSSVSVIINGHELRLECRQERGSREEGTQRSTQTGSIGCWQSECKFGFVGICGPFCTALDCLELLGAASHTRNEQNETNGPHRRPPSTAPSADGQSGKL